MDIDGKLAELQRAAHRGFDKALKIGFVVGFAVGVWATCAAVALWRYYHG